ncbi:Septin-domain-containing protein [Phascolomyces articulosus]|uniref:Septin-domain-containing protein n=1 Tax=Phascolomyces articulosus TaxID=60185 RepID=A0AAD5P8L4_9FUNG|nr:Septin-domain-containing protein [Phascolomyces articulosus]
MGDNSKVFVQTSEASDHWSDSSDHPTSSGAATWSITAADSNAELIVPRVTLGHDDDMLKHSSNNDNNVTGIGHLCIMICGDSGIGKTKLVQAFATMPEMNIAETEELLLDEYAIQETRVSFEDEEQHKSTLCLVDTPGYGASVDAGSIITSVTHYVERQFQKTNVMLNPMCPNTTRLAQFVNNPNGVHSHIDACIYIILDRIKGVDIEYMRALQPLCNLIPVILSQHNNSHHRLNKASSPMSLIQFEFQESGIEPFEIFYPLADINAVASLFSTRILFNLPQLRLLRQSTAEKFVSWRTLQHIVMEGHDESDELSTILSTTTLTNAETVDRMHALRVRHAQNMNLFVSRYVSEKRKLMEKDMFERERALRRELASVDRRKRAELVLRELNALFQQGPIDDLYGISSSISSTNGSSSSASASATTLTNALSNKTLLQEKQKQHSSPMHLITWEQYIKLIIFVLLAIYFVLDVYQSYMVGYSK